MTALPKIEGHIWIGQKPVTLDDLSDKVVLVYFWTYSSSNCLKDLRYVQAWYEKYKDEGFMVVGIHAPEFEFESNPKNVENAVRELGITWPILLDNEHVNWDHFENDSWPAKYLADKEGNIVYSHFGEGDYGEAEAKIRELLDIQGQDVDVVPRHVHGEICTVPTPDTYCGYLRGSIANELSYTEEEEDLYSMPENLREGEVALLGRFFSSPEYIESREEGAVLSVSFHAAEASLVLAPEKGDAEIEVSFNNLPLEKGHAVLINRPGLYTLFQSKEPVSGVLKVTAKRGNFRAYIFTFSGCAE